MLFDPLKRLIKIQHLDACGHETRQARETLEQRYCVWQSGDVSP
jgi:hypothetical protein